MKTLVYILFFILFINLYSQKQSNNILSKNDDYFKRISTKYSVLVKEWGSPDRTDYNSYDDTQIAVYNESDKFGEYAFLSRNNVIYKITHMVQYKNEDETTELYNRISNIFIKEGFSSEILPNDGFSKKTMKFYKDHIIITHNLFPMWEDGKYSTKNLLTLETIIITEK